jgi:hypothetical protein
MKIPAKDYPRFEGVETLNKDMADNADIRRAIIQAVPKANSQVKDFSKHFQRSSTRETCKAIYDFLKHKLNYVADGSEQVIKLPSALLSTKVGDCKSYSLLTSAILTNLGINHHFVLASYNSDPTPSHIYVQLEDGCIIDAVWGIFDSEKKPFYRYEVKPNGKMKVKTLTGIGAKQMGNPLIYAALVAAPAIVDSYKKKSVTGLGGYNKAIGGIFNNIQDVTKKQNVNLRGADLDYFFKFLIKNQQSIFGRKITRLDYDDLFDKYPQLVDIMSQYRIDTDVLDDDENAGNRIWNKAKKSASKSVTGLGGCGCGCNSCATKSIKGIGAFELDAASKAYCDRTYPVLKTWFGDTNKQLRAGCYLRERVQDQTVKSATQLAKWTGDLNLKQYMNAPFRSLYLKVIELNVDNYAKRLQDNPDKRVKLQNQFTRWGGDGNKVFEAIKVGASKKPLSLNFFKRIEDLISKVLPKGITGIGQTSDTMTDAERVAFYKELASIGIPQKPWKQMSVDEKSKYLSHKLTSGVLGGTIRAGLDAGGGAAATAACSFLTIGAAACTPLGVALGEAIYAQIPDVVDMIVRGDGKYKPVAPSGDSPKKVSTFTEDLFKTDGKDKNTALFVVGGIIGGYLLYSKFLKK